MSEPAMKQLLDTMPALQDKLAVTLSSRLTTANEQIRVQKQSQGFVHELLGFISGSTVRRQQQVNGHLADSVEQVVTWLTEVTDHVALGHRAIVQVKQDIATLDRYAGQLAEAVVSQRDKLQQLAVRMDEQLQQLDKRLSHEEHYRRSRGQLRLLIKRWESGKLRSLAPAQRCFVTLQNLYWGEFGNYMLRYPGETADQLVEEVILDCHRMMTTDIDAKPSERVSRQRWFVAEDVADKKTRAALEFLALPNKENDAPYSQAVAAAHQETTMLAFPYWCSGERLLAELMREVNLPQGQRLCVSG